MKQITLIIFIVLGMTAQAQLVQRRAAFIARDSVSAPKYVKGTDTIPSTNEVAKQIEDSLASIGVPGTIQDGILDWQTNRYMPYYTTSPNKGVFYNSSTQPNDFDSTIKFNGYIHGSEIYALRFRTYTTSNVYSMVNYSGYSHTNTTLSRVGFNATPSSNLSPLRLNTYTLLGNTDTMVNFQNNNNSKFSILGSGRMDLVGSPFVITNSGYINSISSDAMYIQNVSTSKAYFRAIPASATLNFTMSSSVSLSATDTLFKVSNNLFERMSLTGNGNLKVTGYITSAKPPHSLLVFRDSAVTITGGTNVQVTNASDSLFRVLESSQITYIKGDTQQITVAGAYNVQLQLRGTGTNGTDWRVTLAKKTGGTTTYSNQNIDFTTTGATNKNGGGAVFYMEYAANDKVWVVLTRVSGSGDFVAETGQFNIQLYYRD